MKAIESRRRARSPRRRTAVLVAATCAAFAACATPPAAQRSSPTADSASRRAAKLPRDVADSGVRPTLRAAPGSDSTVLARIIDEGMLNSGVASDLAMLMDVIGPRLAGSDGMRAASVWSRDRFRALGADSAWLESFPFGAPWERGAARVRLLAPQRRELIGASWAWSPGTGGPRAGDVVLLEARTDSEFAALYAGRLRGAWVMLAPAIRIPNPDGPHLTHADSARLDSVRRAAQPATADERRYAGRRLALVVREGIAGIVRDGGKEYNLLSMSGSPAAPSPVPQVVIGNDDYAQLERLARRGAHPRLEVALENRVGMDSIEERNTVAEIRGSEHPDETVVVGAHLDSWDLGTGATDNGAGVIAVMESARVLAATRARPRRTIRFVLFGAEEEGLYGSQSYAERHRAELARCQAVLVLDNGTGRITGIGLQHRDDLRGLWESVLAPLAAIGPLAVRDEFKTGTDHLSFLPYHVPSFNFDQLSRGYDHTHHSQVDVLDQVVPADVAQAATVLAATAYQLANLPQLIARNPDAR